MRYVSLACAVAGLAALALSRPVNMGRGAAVSECDDYGTLVQRSFVDLVPRKLERGDDQHEEMLALIHQPRPELLQLAQHLRQNQNGNQDRNRNRNPGAPPNSPAGDTLSHGGRTPLRTSPHNSRPGTPSPRDTSTSPNRPSGLGRRARADELIARWMGLDELD